MVKSSVQEPGSIEPAQLSITYTENEDRWVTAQVVECPAAISQGRSRHEAWVNVVDALRDLTHEPTPAERVAFTLEARLAELTERVLELGELGGRLIGATAERARSPSCRSG